VLAWHRAYDEARSLYTSALFGSRGKPTDERRTVHLGIDLQVRPGSAVRAPLDGVVHAFANNKAPLDYGPVVILRHALPTARAAHRSSSLFTGISKRALLRNFASVSRIARGEKFRGGWGDFGKWRVGAHLYFQIITDLFGICTDFPGVARASERSVWMSLCPDPNLLLGIPAERFPRHRTLWRKRCASAGRCWGKNLSVSYRRPLKIVRGWMQYLYDDMAAHIWMFTTMCRWWGIAIREWCARRRSSLRYSYEYAVFAR